MIGPEQVDAATFRRIARRVEDILDAAREREDQGQTMALDIDARFRLEDEAAVQFQVASAILEETGGIGQEEVIAELLAMGMAAVLGGAAEAANRGRATSGLPGDPEPEPLPSDNTVPLPSRSGFSKRVLN